MCGSAKAWNVVRCFHTEPPDGFFRLKDDTDPQLAQQVFENSTPTEYDAINVTSFVTGLNVEILQLIASRGGWRVEFFQLNGFQEV